MNTYTMPYRCTNCFYACLVDIPKRSEAPLYFKCPNCEINTLNKSDRQVNKTATHYTMTAGWELKAA